MPANIPWIVFSYSDNVKRRIVEINMKQKFHRINIFLKDPNKKPFTKILGEVLNLWLIKKKFPIHYFGRFFYRKGAEDCRNFLSMKEYYSIIYSKKLNKEEYLPFLNNKLAFHLLCEKYNIKTPQVTSYNFGADFFFQGKLISGLNANSIAGFFAKVFESAGAEKLFLKPLSSFGGKGIIILSRADLHADMERLGDELIRNSYIHQLAVTQHPEINKIYSHSINTIRIDTYIDDAGKVHTLGIVMRFGTGGNPVDNVSSGGFFALVDSESGRLKGRGHKSMIYGGETFGQHPDTGFVFKDFKIPFFNEALELGRELARYIPNRISGWDIAITPDGPVVIEGNKTPGILMGEIAYGGYMKHPLFKEILANSKIAWKRL